MARKNRRVTAQSDRPYALRPSSAESLERRQLLASVPAPYPQFDLSLGCGLQTAPVTLRLAATAAYQGPTDLILDNTSVAPGQAAGSLVAAISTPESASFDAFTYTFVSGEGAADNGLFRITGKQLRLATDAAASAGGTYSIRLRATDTGGFWIEKPFTINTRGAGTTYTVNSLADVVASDGVVTLREALAAANSNAAPTADVPAGQALGTDRILFDLAALQAQAGTGNTPRIVLDGSVLFVTDHTEIVGPGADLLVLDANQRSGVLETSLTRMITISGLTITGGSRDSGGGILHAWSLLSLTDVKVTGNTAILANSGSGGGGILTALGDLTLRNAIVSDNQVTGGRASSLGGGILLASGNLTLDDVVVSGNRITGAYGLGMGGGIFADRGNAVLRNVTISGNLAQADTGAYGGGVCVNTSTLSMANVVFQGNRATVPTRTGGFVVGGALDAYNTSVSMVNVAAVGNTATAADSGTVLGGAFHIVYGTGQPVNFTATNLTVTGNIAAVQVIHGRDDSFGGGIAFDMAPGARLDNSIVSGNTAANRPDVFGTPSGSNNLIGTDPLFVRNPSPGLDGTWGTSDDDYGDLRPQATSPAINAGNNAAPGLVGVTTDLAGNPRVSGPSVDIGAYERDVVAPPITSTSINNGAAQRSMVTRLSVTFSEPVTLAPGALTVKLSTGAVIPGTTISTTNPSADGKTYLLTFSTGSLPDGIYDLLVTAAGVQDLAGNALTGNYAQRFHRLFGDVDGNKIVNAIDYARLRTTFARSSGDPLFNAGFDYDSNNLINALDLAQFRRRFGIVYSY